jgi:subfamily B ATP-binding cassette protein MsbA
MLPRAASRQKWPLASAYRTVLPLLPLVAALGLLASVLEGAGIGLFIPLLALLLSDTAGGGAPAPIQSVAAIFNGYDPHSRAALLGASIFMLILLKSIVQATNECLAAYVEGRIGRDIREGLSRTLLALDYPFFLRENCARLSHIVAADSWFVLDAAHSTLRLIPAVAGLVVFAGLLAWLNVRLFLIVVAGAAIVEAVLYLFKRRQHHLSHEFTARNQALWQRLLTLVQAPRVIRIFGQQEREGERTAAAIESLGRNVIASRIVKAFVHPVMDTTIALLFLTILLAGYWDGMSIPAITAFLLLLSRAQPHARTLTTARFGIASFRGSLREVEWLLAQEPSRNRPVGKSADVRLEKPIVFKDVSYTYPDGNLAVDHLTVAIRSGVATAVIGESGSGKTTLVNLICRLVEPQLGQIYLGDDPIGGIDPRSWRRRIALAGQDSQLVSGTVRENIVYGRPDASEMEVADAAKAAGIDRFIGRLPQGYDTVVGSTGFSLSGGQRQRVALARALITKPDLLILDEATNAVDAIAEAEIMKLIAEHRFFETILIISHRTTTVAACDDGIVLENGRVMEAGPLSHLQYFRAMAAETAIAGTGRH